MLERFWGRPVVHVEHKLGSSCSFRRRCGALLPLAVFGAGMVACEEQSSDRGEVKTTTTDDGRNADASANDPAASSGSGQAPADAGAPKPNGGKPTVDAEVDAAAGGPAPSEPEPVASGSGPEPAQPSSSGTAPVEPTGAPSNAPAPSGDPAPAVCPAGCPVPAVCKPCESGACATPMILCEEDGSCGAIDWVCQGESPNPDPDPCERPNRRYVSKSPDECTTLRLACEPDEQPFSDECGCGCVTPSALCSGIESSMVEEWSLAAQCEKAADCMAMNTTLCGVETPTLGHVGCYVALNVNADVALLANLEKAVLECGVETAECECGQAPLADCTDGLCRVLEPLVDDPVLCSATGGTWVTNTCGHYDCGNPPICATLIPGCDCGPKMNFAYEAGCVEDPDCPGD